MSALPADIAAFTNDGVIVTSPVDRTVRDAIKATHIDFQSTGDTPLEMFFDTVADTQAMLDERFAILSQVNPLHLGLEVSDTLGLGKTIPLAPNVPCFIATDGDRINQLVRTRAYGVDMATDRYSVEVIQ